MVLDQIYKTLHLFAGGGGGILADLLLRHIPIGAVEIEAYPREILFSRQADNILPWFPIWDDVRSFRTKNPATRDYFAYLRSIREELAICGGFPCQDISCAGKGAGITGERSGLWGEMFRVVRKIRPARVFVENSSMLTGRGLGRVLGDLAKIGYNAVWCVLGADDCGAPHQRKRIWIMAYPTTPRFQEWSGDKVGQPKKKSQSQRQSGQISHSNLQGLEKRKGKQRDYEPQQPSTFGIHRVRWWDEDPADIPDTDKFNDDYGGYGTGKIFRERFKKANISRSKKEVSNAECLPGEQQRDIRGVGREKQSISRDKRREGDVKPRLGRMVVGMADRIHRLKAIGNGQVSAVAAAAWIILEKQIRKLKE